MPALTSEQLLDLAKRFRAMADAVQLHRLSLDPGSSESTQLRQARQELINVSSALLTSSLNTALDELAPHYDAMLSVVADLTGEVAKQSQIAKILAIVDAAVAISAALVTGNPTGLGKAIEGAKSLL